MSLICPNHKTTLLKDPVFAYQSWQQLMHDGSRCHSHNDYTAAQRYFSTAVELSTLIIGETEPQDPVRMYMLASHNLGASFNADAQPLMAERTLVAMHTKISQLCTCQELCRDLRLKALAQLDDSLFSLLSHLGGQGKSELLHNILLSTEVVAEKTARQMFH